MNDFQRMHQARIMGEVAHECHGRNIVQSIMIEKMARALLQITDDVRMSDDEACTLTAHAAETAPAFITVQVHQ